jgi:hypothetical protein
MLYVGCGRCGAIGPYYCGGQFMPHVPVLAEPTPWGPACGFCGQMQPTFTCGRCFTTQWLVQQGAAMPQGYQWGQPVAGAIQAPSGASHSQLNGLLGEFMKGLGQGVVNWATS